MITYHVVPHVQIRVHQSIQCVFIIQREFRDAFLFQTTPGEMIVLLLDTVLMVITSKKNVHLANTSNLQSVIYNCEILNSCRMITINYLLSWMPTIGGCTM